MLAESPDQTPVDGAITCLTKLVLRHGPKKFAVFDRLMLSTGALRVRKEAIFV